MSKEKFLLKYGNTNHIHQSLNGGNYGSDDVINSIEKNPQWDQTHTQHVLDQGWGWNTKKHAISHPSTSPELLHKIINEPKMDLHQLAAVATHPNATEEHRLNIIDKGQHFPVDSMLSETPSGKLTPKIYEHAANHPNEHIRTVVAKSITTPEHVLHKLSNDSNDKVAKAAKNTLEFNTEMNDLFGDKDA